MAKRQQYASMAPKDASTGGAFAGGVTTVKRCRFGYGYPKGDGSTVSEEVITLRMTHRPKAGGGEERIDFFSCGNSAAKNFSVSKDGKQLVPRSRSQTTSINASSNAMIFIESLVKAGFPDEALATRGVTAIEGLRFRAEQRPVRREGLDLEDESRPKTVLVCAPKGILDLPTSIEGGEGEGEDDEEEGEEEEDDEDEGEEEAEEEAEEDAEGEGDDAEEEDEDEDEEEDEEEPAVSDTLVAKHLTRLLTDAGDAIKLAKLGSLAYSKLRTWKVENRNAVVKRMVEPAFLKKAKGVTFDAKGGGSVSLG